MGGILSRCFFKSKPKSQISDVKKSDVKKSEAKIVVTPNSNIGTSKIQPAKLYTSESSISRNNTSVSFLDISSKSTTPNTSVTPDTPKSKHVVTPIYDNTLNLPREAKTPRSPSKHKTVSGHYSKVLTKNNNPDFELIYTRASVGTPINVHQSLNVSFLSNATYGTRVDAQIRQAIKTGNLPQDLMGTMGFVNYVREGKDIRTHQKIGNNLMGAEYDVYRDGNIIDIKMSKNDVFGKKQNWAQLLIYASLMIQLNDRIDYVSLYDVGRGQILSVSLEGVDLNRVYASLLVDI